MDSSKSLSTRLPHTGQVSKYQLDLLFHPLIYTSLASNIAAIFIFIVLWSYADQKVLLIWLSAIIIISAAGILLTHLYHKKLPDHSELAPWNLMSLLLIILAGLSWGSLAILYSVEWPAFQQFAVVTTLLIIALAAILVCATNLLFYQSALLTIMGPIIGVFIFKEGQYYPAYAGGLFCLVVFLYMIAWRYYHTVNKQVYDLAILQQDYQDLKRSHDDLCLTLEKKDMEEKVSRAVFTRIAKLRPVQKDGITGLVEPMGNFSGDFIYSAVTPENQSYILFADFSGHGLQAALGAIPVSSIFYSMTAKGLSPEKIIHEINKNLFQLLATDQFCCACFISINAERSDMKIWNGGIPDVFLLNQKGGFRERIRSTHLPLGITLDEDDFSFETFRLNKGEIVLAYTDGVIEAQNDHGEIFGVSRLETCLAENYQNKDLLEMINTTIKQYSGNVIQSDDISLLEIRC